MMRKKTGLARCELNKLFNFQDITAIMFITHTLCVLSNKFNCHTYIHVVCKFSDNLSKCVVNSSIANELKTSFEVIHVYVLETYFHAHVIPHATNDALRVLRDIGQ